MTDERLLGDFTRGARLAAGVALALMVGTSLAQAAPTPTQKCQASKELAAGKYALCRMKAEKKRTLTGDATKYDEALTLCQGLLSTAWQTAEQDAAKKGVTCADAALPVAQFALAIDGLANHVAAATGGSGSPAVCDNSCVGKADGTTCDAGVDGGNTLICVGGTCQACVPDGNGVATRYVDNGDGSITDLHTCLVWEKKDDSGGIHDKENGYTWSIPADPQGDCAVASCPPNGDVFTVFLASLNDGHFAAHADWRLPSSGGNATYPTGQPPQLESLVEGAFPACGDGSVDPVVPCINPIFDANCGVIHPNQLPSTGNPGCTVDGAGNTPECSCVSNYYTWSSTDWIGNSVEAAWSLWETYGGLSPSSRKTFPQLARAVRGGVVFIP